MESLCIESVQKSAMLGNEAEGTRTLRGASMRHTLTTMASNRSNDQAESALVAVTGANGFLGRALVSHLLAQSTRVRAISRITAPPAANLESIRAGLHDVDALQHAFKGCQCIFHLAAHVHDVRSADDSALQQHVTLDGTRSMLEAAQKASVPSVVLVSSLAVFGEVGNGAVYDEDAPNPVTAYGRAKLAAEEALVEFTHRTGYSGAIVRPALIYGIPCPGNLARMVRGVQAGWFPPIPEFGNRRSMVFVDDVAHALHLAWEHHGEGARSYIITDGEGYSTREIYEMILHALGRRASGIRIPKILFRSAARVGDAARTLAGRRLPFDSQALEKLSGSAFFDSSRARRELAFAPTTTLREAMPALVESIVSKRAAAVSSRAAIQHE